MPDLELIFHHLKPLIDTASQTLASEPLVSFEYEASRLPNFRRLRLKREAALLAVEGFRSLDPRVVSVTAEVISIIESQPLLLSKPSQVLESRASVERFGNAVFAFYFLTGRLGVDPGQLPRRVLRNLTWFLYHIRPQGHEAGNGQGYCHLTAALWFMEAMVRPRWLTKGFRWKNSALEPHFFPPMA